MSGEDYIKKRIKHLQDDEDLNLDNGGMGMSFTTEDVIQELKWALEAIKKGKVKVVFS